MPRTRASGFRTIFVYCVGQYADRRRCWHSNVLQLDQLPQVTWFEIGCRLRCTACGNRGFVGLRIDWREVIDYSKPKGGIRGE